MATRIILAAVLAAFSTTPFAADAERAFDARLFDSPALASPYREDLSADEKVAGLSKFWAEVKYNFVYVDKLKELDWDRLYLETIPKVRATTSTAEYYRVLSELCAKLQDGHTNVYPAPELRDEIMTRPLFTTGLIEGKVLVREVYDDKLKAQGVLPGVEVVAVNGVPSIAYAQRELAPIVSASTPHDLENRVYGFAFLMGPRKETPRVSFMNAAGKRFDVDTPRVGWPEFAKARKQQPFELRMLPGNVAYVALNSFGDAQAADAFMAAFDRIAKASGLVIDVRENGGGNSSEGWRVLATLTDKPFDTGRWSTRQYLPAYRAWQQPMPDLERTPHAQQADGKRHFKGLVAVLTSKATYSAAEDFAVAFDAMKRGVIVGEATGGSTGQPLMIQLPGGGMARICTKADTYPDGTRWVGKGVQPTVKIATTVHDVRRGRDTVLEAALARLRQDGSK